MRVICDRCGIEKEFRIAKWRCDCGGTWEPAIQDPFNQGKIYGCDYSIWRYGEMLGLDVRRPVKRMGVGWTPLVSIRLDDQLVYLKLEFLSPSGSFKDRGVNAMVNQLISMGAKKMVEDSSGNAGASLAAHAARFGIKAQIYVPAYASPHKLTQISIYGVEVKTIPGPRKAAEDAAKVCASPEVAYASHAYNPAYLAGQTTAAWEMWEQLGKETPDWIFCPVAQGGQFLGLWFGFKRLLSAGLIDRLPRLVAVQSAMIAPIYNAWMQGLNYVPGVEPNGTTIAEGVAIAKPARGGRILQAIRETGGEILAIGELDIIKAQNKLAHLGFYIEPTSALAAAGFYQLQLKIKHNEIVVIPLTGSGLKGKPKY